MTPTSTGALGDGRLGDQFEAIRGRYRLPALVGMTFTTDRLLESGAAGVRALGYPELATVGDQWHIGSLTKSMTATLAAILVEQGRVAWDARLQEAFPDVSMRPEYASVRLDELLTHTSGLVIDMTSAPSWPTLRDSRLPIHEQRRRLAAEYLSSPGSTRGSYVYSNAGYIVAGTLLEQATGETWEDMLRRAVFAPLGMTRTGFGAPGIAPLRDQPWGHSPSGGGFTPLMPGVDADNPAAIGPAGTVHATLADLSAYFRMHLNGARGVASLVSVDSFSRLHQPAPGSEYACGWVVLERPWGGGNVLYHNGSNGYWFAVAWIAPIRGFGVFAATNAYTNASQATNDAVGVLITRFQAANPAS